MISRLSTVGYFGHSPLRFCEDWVKGFFEMDTDSLYMLLVAPVQEKRRLPLPAEQAGLWGIELLNIPRSDIPAVTHLDYSARIQTLHESTNPDIIGCSKPSKRTPAIPCW